MVNLIIVADDQDEAIGLNCTRSHEYFASQIDLQPFNVAVLNGEYCTSDAVEQTVGTFNQQTFILVAYSHGCESALTSSVSTLGYVNSANAYLFSTSLVYTNCCYSAQLLRHDLIAAGCYGYVGYTDKVRLPENDEDEMAFIACENSGLIHFLTTGETLSESVEVMRTKYRAQIDEFYAQDMFAAAALLNHNLNCLAYHDCDGLTRERLEN